MKLRWFLILGMFIQLPSASGDPPYPLEDTFQLHSYPSATKVIYLDFDGHDGDTGYDRDGNPSSFNDAEREQIQFAWQRASEDFRPFNVDVTTEFPGIESLRKRGGGDTHWGVRVVVYPGDGSSGGWAYVDSFDSFRDQPCYVDTNGAGTGNKNIAEVISHEVGHTLGLNHDGEPDDEYYDGHGSGGTGWAPIMGIGYYKPVTQWSRGEYTGATNTQDDLQIITTQNGFGYRPDDHGSSMGDADLLTPLAGMIIRDEGIIERNTDLDYFAFTTVAKGDVDLTIEPFEIGPNLDVLASIYDASGDLVAESNPSNALGAVFHVNLTAGDYYLAIDGTGTGNPYADYPNGYTDYGSLGYYRITGTVLTELAGDITFDGEVDGDDVEAFIDGWRTTGHGSVEDKIAHGNLNLDDITDLADWYLLRQAFIASGNSGLVGALADGLAIPEPSSLILGASLFVGLVAMRRRVNDV